MTPEEENKIIRAAQKFLDSITFSLNIQSDSFQIKESLQQSSQDQSNSIRDSTGRKSFNKVGEGVKKKKEWTVGEIISGQEMTKFNGKRLLFTNKKVKNHVNFNLI